jgi:hypothetical protein
MFPYSTVSTVDDMSLLHSTLPAVCLRSMNEALGMILPGTV